MRFAVALAMFAWAVQFSGPAAADLYRWVDPETGSIKFSNYPPPWFGDPARERRAPKVEVIPDRSSAPSPGPKPEAEARPEPKPEPRRELRSEPGEPRPAARPADKTPDGPADKSAANPAAKREPAPMKDKDGFADGR